MRINRLSFISFSLAAMLSLVVTISCTNNKGTTSEDTSVATAGTLPVFTLEEQSTYDFGTVKDGEIVEKSFAFKNTGSGPLVISNIAASCGCTTPEWPKEPIAPGEESNIMVRFNTTGKPGQQNKTVTITANTEPSTIELHLKGVVAAK